MWASILIFRKLPKVNNHPLGKNSPNLVTLLRAGDVWLQNRCIQMENESKMFSKEMETKKSENPGALHTYVQWWKDWSYFLQLVNLLNWFVTLSQIELCCRPRKCLLLRTTDKAFYRGHNKKKTLKKKRQVHTYVHTYYDFLPKNVSWKCQRYWFKST
jgi:hypothetical protein